MPVSTSLPSDCWPERAADERSRFVGDLDEGPATDVVDEIDPDHGRRGARDGLGRAGRDLWRDGRGRRRAGLGWDDHGLGARTGRPPWRPRDRPPGGAPRRRPGSRSVGRPPEPVEPIGSRRITASGSRRRGCRRAWSRAVPIARSGAMDVPSASQSSSRRSRSCGSFMPSAPSGHQVGHRRRWLREALATRGGCVRRLCRSGCRERRRSRPATGRCSAAGRGRPVAPA